MHKIMTTLAALALTVAAAAATRRPAIKLINRMAALQRQGVMIGHQDDPLYGCSWKWEAGRSDVKDVCGSYPAVMGFELGDIELGHEKSLDGVPFSLIRKEAVAQHERGGIVTMSWHANNPLTGKNAWDPAGGEPVKQILPGGKLNAKFRAWLHTVARFMASLKTADGEAVPVIFRPWHEMSGGWFWWGEGQCTPAEYKQLYRYTHDFMTRYGCSNIVWAYSPNLADEKETPEHFERYYPGDDVVDLLGIDVYQRGPDNAQYQQWLRNELDVVKQAGEKHRKLIALTETGYQDVPDATWFTKALLPVLKEYPLCYVLLWRNAWDQAKENYASAPGKATEQDFKDFYEDKHTLFLNDIKQ